MTALELPADAYLSGAALLCALAAMGTVIGVLTGLFGVGGAFLITPMMIVLLGIDESLAVGSSLCFVVGTAAAGSRRHARLKNVEPRSMLILSAGAVAGTVLGTLLHQFLRSALAQGALDFRVVDTQGISTFTALQRRGIPSKLLYFPDENHWVSKPHNSILWHDTVISWLDQWVKE